MKSRGKKKIQKKKIQGQNKLDTLGLQKLQSKRGLAHHDAAVADEGKQRQRLGEGISDHFMCAQRDEFVTKPALTSSRMK